MMEQAENLSQLEPKDPDIIRIIQITDTHILDDESSFNDFDTSASLSGIVNEIIKLETDTDLILLTGDLVHEPNKSSYQKLADHLSRLTTPILFLPGNHDAPETMNYVLGTNGYDTGNVIKVGDWIIILLNTCVQGQHSGKLSADELTFLSTVLSENPESHCLIALHHHPVSINSKWMDAMPLVNADEFLGVVDQHDQIQGIIWGHIHQEFESQRGEVRLFGTPSTCMQFKPKSDEFAISDNSPAYRKLTLTKQGLLDSKVIYLEK